MKVVFCSDQSVFFSEGDKRNVSFKNEEEVWDAERADLLAFIHALRNITPFDTCTIQVDSHIIFEGVGIWLKYWEQTKYNYGHLRNADLWREVSMLYRPSITVQLKR